MEAKKSGTKGKAKGDKVRTVIFLPAELKLHLKHAALDRDCSASDIVIAALRAYLKT